MLRDFLDRVVNTLIPFTRPLPITSLPKHGKKVREERYVDALADVHMITIDINRCLIDAEASYEKQVVVSYADDDEYVPEPVAQMVVDRFRKAGYTASVTRNADTTTFNVSWEEGEQ